MRPASNRGVTTAFIRKFSLAIFLVLPPCLFIHENEHIWISRVSASKRLYSSKNAALLVKGFSAFSPRPSKKIALCITGHLRSFHKPSVYMSIKRNVVDTLENSGWSVDVFFHVGRRDIPRTGIKPAISFSPRLTLNLFKPVRVSFYDRHDECRKHACKNRRQNMTCPHGLLRTQQCMSLVENYEKRKGIRYSWVYKTRPDVAFGSRISTPDLLDKDYLYTNQHIPGASTHAHSWLRQKFEQNASVLGPPVGDQILVASREVAEVAFRAAAAYSICDLYDLPTGTLNSEVALTFWLVKNRVRYKTQPWFWLLVRDLEGPECERIRHIRGVDQLGVQKLMDRCTSYEQSGKLSEK